MFKPDGKFKKRLVTGDALHGPWGMAIAPKHWGKFGGRLLVGNVDDGKINAFDTRSGNFKGTLKDASGAPLVNARAVGHRVRQRRDRHADTLIFSAGIGNDPR